MPRRGAIADVPASVLLELAADPEAYKKMLDTISLRLTEAGEAEAKAAKSKTSALVIEKENASRSITLDDFARKLDSRAASVIVSERQIAADRAALALETKSVSQAAEAVRISENSIDARAQAALDSCRALLGGN